MAASLRTLCFSIWRSKYERQGIQPSYHPLFLRHIGMEDAAEYADILKTLYDKSKECPYSVFFDGSIPMQAAFDIITYVGKELQSMDVTDLKSQDIQMFDENLNPVFLLALDKTVNLALKQETFFNSSSRNDFILKLIVWAYSYICPISQHFLKDYSPKCFYYGNISRHEAYFLIMLHFMGFDVVYMNPSGDCCWADVEKNGISEAVHGKKTMQPVPLQELISGALGITEESITLQLQREMDDTLFHGSGCYRAWQFRDGNTKPLFIRSTIIDLANNYAEPAKIRSGFKVDGKMVTVPNFFFQIDGIYNDFAEYKKLVTDCISTPNTYVITDRCEHLVTKEVEDRIKLKLSFCRKENGDFDIEELKKFPIYTWDKYRDSLEDFMLSKINDVLKSRRFKKKPDGKEQMDFVCDILMINEDILKMADSFDYSDKVPKIVVFLDNEDSVNDRMLYLLGYIVELGFDVVIFSPSGFASIDSVFHPDYFNNERLETMSYDCTLEKVKKWKPAGFFKKLFR